MEVGDAPFGAVLTISDVTVLKVFECIDRVEGENVLNSGVEAIIFAGKTDEAALVFEEVGEGLAIDVDGIMGVATVLVTGGDTDPPLDVEVGKTEDTEAMLVDAAEAFVTALDVP